jgi:hypothetical protein
MRIRATQRDRDAADRHPWAANCQPQGITAAIALTSPHDGPTIKHIDDPTMLLSYDDALGVIARLVAARYISWQGIGMIGRADVERAIVDDESMLEQLAGLLEGGADLAAWPEDLRIALALALEEPSMSSTEIWKAVTLRRHLFGPAGLVPEQIGSIQQPSAAARRRAEGLRSGLPARVRYRVATYMLPAVR